jgi:class 3 adenylate cyclase
MGPEELLDWINDVMGHMADAVERTGGVVNDYFGDGLFALFGVPFARGSEAEIDADARSAVGCAVEMARTLGELNAMYRTRGFPQVQLRIGIHTGAVVAGSVGSAKRLKYTVMGDAVVTSKRLESLDDVEPSLEDLACRILISAATERRLGDRFQRKPLGTHPLKGKHEEVDVYRVIA